MTRCVSLAVLFVVFTIGVAVVPSAAPACAPAPMKGEEVHISGESALIVWDEATKTEHFIRRATFQSTSAEFGFLVPTPSKPDVGPADDAVFTQLEALTAPKIEYRTVKRPRPKPQRNELKSSPMPGGPGGVMGVPPPRGSVEVLDRKQFDGIEAVVLAFKRAPGEADPTFGAEELATWLKKHGYDFGPTLVEWIKPYVANSWVMTAFRIAADAPKGAGPPGSRSLVALRGVPVRMSFKAERPFYPYREPANQREQPKADPRRGPNFGPQASRSLRVFFVSTGRFDGTLGGATNAPHWPGRTVWTDKINADQLKAVASGAKLPGGAPTGTMWLTEFEDRSFPRPGTDEVYFGLTKDQSTIERPKIVHEVVEYYDEPASASESTTSAEPAPRSHWLVIVAGAAGAVAFGFFLLLIVWTLRRG